MGRIKRARAKAGRAAGPFTFGLFAFAVVTASLEAAEPLLEHPFIKSMLLTSRPPPSSATGRPTRSGRESSAWLTTSRADSVAMRCWRWSTPIPQDVVREYVLHGSPDDIKQQLAPFVRAGLEHVVPLNLAPMADPACARESFALTDSMARGLEFDIHPEETKESHPS